MPDPRLHQVRYYAIMDVTLMSQEQTVACLRASSSRSPSEGPLPRRPSSPTPNPQPPSADDSVSSGHGSSTGPARSIRCSGTNAAARCASPPSSSSRAPSSRSSLTWLERADVRAAQLCQSSHLRALLPSEARWQGSSPRLRAESPEMYATGRGWWTRIPPSVSCSYSTPRPGAIMPRCRSKGTVSRVFTVVELISPKGRWLWKLGPSRQQSLARGG